MLVTNTVKDHAFFNSFPGVACEYCYIYLNAKLTVVYGESQSSASLMSLADQRSMYPVFRAKKAANYRSPVSCLTKSCFRHALYRS